MDHGRHEIRRAFDEDLAPVEVLLAEGEPEAVARQADARPAAARGLEIDALGAEGMEISVPARGSARPIVRDMIKHLCSSVSYGGASSLAELRRMFWADPEAFLIKQSPSGRRESYERTI